MSTKNQSFIWERLKNTQKGGIGGNMAVFSKFGNVYDKMLTNLGFQEFLKIVIRHYSA